MRAFALALAAAMALNVAACSESPAPAGEPKATVPLGAAPAEAAPSAAPGAAPSGTPAAAAPATTPAAATPAPGETLIGPAHQSGPGAVEPPPGAATATASDLCTQLNNIAPLAAGGFQGLRGPVVGTRGAVVIHAMTETFNGFEVCGIAEDTTTGYAAIECTRAEGDVRAAYDGFARHLEVCPFWPLAGTQAQGASEGRLYSYLGQARPTLYLIYETGVGAPAVILRMEP